MSEDKNWKILQIISAQADWKAVHCDGLEDAEMKISIGRSPVGRCLNPWKEARLDKEKCAASRRK